MQETRKVLPVSPPPVKHYRELIYEILGVIPLANRLYVHADAGGRLPQVTDEGPVPRSRLLQRAHRKHGAVPGEPEALVRVEEIEDMALHIPPIFFGEVLDYAFRRLGPIEADYLLFWKQPSERSHIDSRSAAKFVDCIDIR